MHALSLMGGGVSEMAEVWFQPLLKPSPKAIPLTPTPPQAHPVTRTHQVIKLALKRLVPEQSTEFLSAVLSATPPAVAARALESWARRLKEVPPHPAISNLRLSSGATHPPTHLSTQPPTRQQMSHLSKTHARSSHPPPPPPRPSPDPARCSHPFSPSVQTQSVARRGQSMRIPQTILR